MARNGRFSLSRLKDEYGRQREAGSGRGRSLKRAYRTVKSNPRKVKGKSTTLRNMAFVSIPKQRNGVIKITGRKMAGNPTKRRCRICGRKMSAIALARHSCSNRDIALYNRSKNRRKR